MSLNNPRWRPNWFEKGFAPEEQVSGRSLSGYVLWAASLLLLPLIALIYGPYLLWLLGKRAVRGWF